MEFSILKEGKLVCCTMIGGKITHEPGAGSGTLATFKERRSMGIFKISGIAYWTMKRIEDENDMATHLNVYFASEAQTTSPSFRTKMWPFANAGGA